MTPVRHHIPSIKGGGMLARHFVRQEEEDVRKEIILAMGAMVILAGCGLAGDDSAKIPVKPKWPGPPYHISFDTKAAKPNAAGVTIPNIIYKGNPEALENRATLVVRFDASGAAKKDGPVANKMIMAPVDIKDVEGVLPPEYMDAADQGLARFFGAYGIKGKVKISVAIDRSSLTPQASDTEVENKRLSDWVPVEVVFKNPHRG
jgi:hypothetical protein